MLQSYLKIAWRNLLKRKSFSFINIMGLSIGMAGTILILLWLQNEVSFDAFHANRDNLYEVYGLSNATDHPTAISQTPQPLGPALNQNYPEIEGTTRVADVSSLLITANGKSFTNSKGDFVDPSFLKLFTFPLTDGTETNQLNSVYSILITKKLATKLFGTEEAVGKLIRIDSVDNFTVVGVLKDLPANTRFDFEYLLQWDYLKKLGWSNESWLSNNISTFVLLKPNVNVSAFNEKIKNITRQNSGRNEVWSQFLFPLHQWHLYADFENGKPAGGRIVTVRIFGIIALFILLIACINFMNLSTARSEQRAKEIGIRKVAGASKSLLVVQFITEAFFTACLAGAIALLIVQLVLPWFNALTDTALTIPYRSGFFWLCASVFILFTSLLAGSYPAFYLSSFEPVGIFKKQFKKVNAALSPRKILVVLQFTFAVVLIIATLIIHNQIVYAENRDKGYSNNNLVHVNFAGDMAKNYALIKQNLLRDGIAYSVTKNMTGITEGGARSWGLRWQNEAPSDTNTAIALYSTDADLVKTMGLHLLDGRDIDIYRYPADSFSVLLNEAAIAVMNFKNPIGQILNNPYEKVDWRVVGVIKNYVEGSPYAAVPPTVIMGPGAAFNAMHIKFNPALSTSAALDKTETIFKKYNPAYPFDYKFVDQQYAVQFNNEERTKTLAGMFAFLAIFISCLGLFGLSAYVVETRIKEIGVRKILGATVFNIAKLLSFDFVTLVLISIIIAIPVAWFGMNKWLQGYNYRINISWTIFFVAGLLAITIALITVSFQSIKAAIANPVKSLRAE